LFKAWEATIRYSQPFGVPDQPIGPPYYRYVNGKPVAGTEGSIPLLRRSTFYRDL
jgi:hypothetical protein